MKLTIRKHYVNYKEKPEALETYGCKEFWTVSEFEKPRDHTTKFYAKDGFSRLCPEAHIRPEFALTEAEANKVMEAQK